MLAYVVKPAVNPITTLKLDGIVITLFCVVVAQPGNPDGIVAPEGNDVGIKYVLI